MIEVIAFPSRLHLLWTCAVYLLCKLEEYRRRIGGPYGLDAKLKMYIIGQLFMADGHIINVAEVREKARREFGSRFNSSLFDNAVGVIAEYCDRHVHGVNVRRAS